MSKKQQQVVGGKKNVTPATGQKHAKARKVAEYPVFHSSAAGIDIGAREIFVAVPADRDDHPVRRYDTFTCDLRDMAEWLKRCGVTTVAMESTGVYWIPVYDMLEENGIQGCLVNPRNMKNVPGNFDYRRSGCFTSIVPNS